MYKMYRMFFKTFFLCIVIMRYRVAELLSLEQMMQTSRHLYILSVENGTTMNSPMLSNDIKERE